MCLLVRLHSGNIVEESIDFYLQLFLLRLQTQHIGLGLLIFLLLNRLAFEYLTLEVFIDIRQALDLLNQLIYFVVFGLEFI